MDLLHEAIERGILNISHIRDELDMIKRKDCLEMHPNAIWQGKDGNWYSYLPDEEKGRILRKRTTKKGIEDVVVQYWRDHTENPTINDIFTEWNNRRLELGKIAPSTHLRYSTDFRKHFTDFGKRRIRNITSEDVEDFIDEQLGKFQFTAKSYGNLRTITKGLLKYAKKKRYISFPVKELFDDLDISEHAFKKVVREDYEEVFNDEEMERMLIYLEEHQDLSNLGIMLMFVTGLRIGEVVALKQTDISDGAIRIRRTETRFKDEDGHNRYIVKDYPKTKAGVRTVVVPQTYIWITDRLVELSGDGDYLFCKNDKRMTTNCLRKRLERLCDKLDIYRKSPHKIRKTYGSILLDNNVDKRLITELMGHTNIAITEMHYHRNRRSIDAKIATVSAIPELMGKQKSNQ